MTKSFTQFKADSKQKIFESYKQSYAEIPELKEIRQKSWDIRHDSEHAIWEILAEFDNKVAVAPFSEFQKVLIKRFPDLVCKHDINSWKCTDGTSYWHNVELLLPDKNIIGDTSQPLICICEIHNKINDGTRKKRDFHKEFQFAEYTFDREKDDVRAMTAIHMPNTNDSAQEKRNSAYREVIESMLIAFIEDNENFKKHKIDCIQKINDSDDLYSVKLKKMKRWKKKVKLKWTRFRNMLIICLQRLKK